MPKRIIDYSNTTVSISHLQHIKDLKTYAKEKFNVTLSSQKVVDFALEQAVKHREALREFLPDPEVEAYLALRAKLLAAGKLPE